MLVHSVPCIDNEHVYETCRRSIFTTLRAMKVSPDTSY